jgi:NifB/MoaA-like Fe-S oxidoreductase
MVFAADEYYLLAGCALPEAPDYEGYPQHENGIGMARAFAEAFGRRDRVEGGPTAGPGGVRHGFFAAVDAAPAEGYRAPRLPTVSSGTDHRAVTVVTGHYGATVLAPLLADHGRTDLTLMPVANDYFGGNIGVAGLLTGTDVGRAVAAVPDDTRCLVPDACLNEGRFLDGVTLDQLPREVEVVPTDGTSLRRALDGDSFRPVETTDRSACPA